MRVLIVEDELPIAEGLKFNFQQEGYSAQICGDGPSALAAMRGADGAFDLVVLDLMLPGMSGYEICKEIRAHDPHVPILVLSARSDSKDKAYAFDCGADQYVTKPFDLGEVLSRVRNLTSTRRRESSTEPLNNTTAGEVFQFADVTVDCRRFEVLRGEQKHELTTMEMQLLRYFLLHDEMVLSRSQILRDVWSQSPEITTRTIDNFVMRLRKIIEPNPSRPQHILSVRGTGYRFVGPVKRVNVAHANNQEPRDHPE